MKLVELRDSVVAIDIDTAPGIGVAGKAIGVGCIEPGKPL